MGPSTSALLAERERAADRAHDELVREMSRQRAQRFEAGAVLRDQVLDLELVERIDDAGDALLAEAAQVKAADDRVDLRHAGDSRRPATDADDAAVRARGHDDEPAVAHVGDQR